MPVRLLDGPGVDLTFELRLAPTFLRVVQSPSKWDALDQPDDVPEPGEHVHVYRLVPGTWSSYHIRGASRASSGCFATCDYRWVADAPVELRETTCWRVWATLQPGPDGEPLRPLPTGVLVDLTGGPVEHVRIAAAAFGAVEHDDCWALPA
jgi:hypothetical protein